MKRFPFNFRELGGGHLIVNDAGGFAQLSSASLSKLVDDDIDEALSCFLKENGFLYRHAGDHAFISFMQKYAIRASVPNDLAYLILVPTLRCNLACTYCQVSRAAEGASGYDWDEATLRAVIRLLGGLEAPRIKIEFQGGEPCLRPDLLSVIAEFCREKFEETEFVVCTNLSLLDGAVRDLFDAEDFFISTSLDGPPEIHRTQRTESAAAQRAFSDNFEWALRTYGHDKLSPLPTIDYVRYPDPRPLIDAYRAYGYDSIHLRPVAPYGFAGKARKEAGYSLRAWMEYYRTAIKYIFARNQEEGEGFYEFYFMHLLRRIFRTDVNNYTDLRSPNLYGRDFLLIDFDGTIYPTDEARMLNRTGTIDLSIGHVSSGLDRRKLAEINAESSNACHPECVLCAYRPYCGIDLVDDIARTGRIDAFKPDSWFCGRHMAMFDLVFSCLYSGNDAVRFSLSKWLLGAEGDIENIVASDNDSLAF